MTALQVRPLAIGPFPERSMKWKTRLADYFPWLRDEEWHEKLKAQAIADRPWLYAQRIELVEMHKLDEPYLGHIWLSVFPDGRTGYTAEIFRPDPEYTGTGLAGRGTIGRELFDSLEDARAAIPQAYEEALAQWSNTVVRKDGSVWLGHLPSAESVRKKDK